MFEMFITCVTFYATIACGGNLNCVDVVKECILDGESIEFCAKFEYGIENINPNNCREYLEKSYLPKL